jgi:transposase
MRINFFLYILVNSYLIFNFYINFSLVSKKTEKNRGVIRELLKYEFELGHTAKEAMDNINRAKGHGIVAKRTAYEWFSKFKNNQMEIADKKRAGRPREIDRAAVVNTVEAHPSMTTRMLAEDFDCAQSQIVEILHAAG